MSFRDYVNFVLGGVVAVSIVALQTDYLGLEGYIKKLRSPGGWLEAKYSISLYTILILVSAVCLFANNKEKLHKEISVKFDASDTDVAKKVNEVLEEIIKNEK